MHNFKAPGYESIQNMGMFVQCSFNSISDLIPGNKVSDDLTDAVDLTDDEQSTLRLLLKSMLRSPALPQDDIADFNTLRKLSVLDDLRGELESNSSNLDNHWSQF